MNLEFRDKDIKIWTTQDTENWLKELKSTYRLKDDFEKVIPNLKVAGFRLIEYSNESLNIISPYYGNFIYESIQSILSKNGYICNEKTWIFGHSVVNSKYYHIDLNYLQLPKLDQLVSKGGYYLVPGPYRSGKTTHLIAIGNVFIAKGYIVLNIKLHPTSNIWNRILYSLKTQLNYNGKLDNIKDFQEIFHKNYTIFPGKRFVLLFDECQILEQCEYGESFLNYLKGVTDDKDNYNIHSVVYFGTYQILHLFDEGRNRHLFSEVSSIMDIQPLPNERVTELLMCWASDIKFKFDYGVAEDIATSIGGYAGLLGLVGINLQTFLNRNVNNRIITMEVWNEIKKLCLGSMSTITNQFTSINLYLQNSPPASDLLKLILYSKNQKTFDLSPEQIEHALVLLDYGILLKEKETISRFYLGSPLITEYLLSTFTPSKTESNTLENIKFIQFK